MNLKMSPLKIINILLGLFALGAIYFNNFSQAVLLHLLASVGLAIILFATLKFLTKKPKSIYNTISTALIIFLVLHSNSLPATALATTIATFSKFFLEKQGSPAINPAVFGIILATLLLKLFGSDSTIASWWGTNYKLFGGYFTLALLAIWTIFFLKQWRKYAILISFLIPHAIFTYFYSGIEAFQFVFTDATIYFFATIMLIEPRTSPIEKTDQIAYGILAAVLYNALAIAKIPQASLYCIAIVNLVFFIKKSIK